MDFHICFPDNFPYLIWLSSYATNHRYLLKASSILSWYYSFWYFLDIFTQTVNTTVSFCIKVDSLDYTTEAVFSQELKADGKKI